MWAARAERFPQQTPATREYYLLREIFEDSFPSPHALATVPFVRPGPCDANRAKLDTVPFVGYCAPLHVAQSGREGGFIKTVSPALMPKPLCPAYPPAPVMRAGLGWPHSPAHVLQCGRMHAFGGQLFLLP